ncbi:MAG: membrane-spanning protein [Clostridiales bacterium]|nr:membrane-spanning protein [Clostridiales bacterium]
MNCRKYRACLAGVIALALLYGAFLFVKYGKESRVPEGGTLVKERVLREGGRMEWA